MRSAIAAIVLAGAAAASLTAENFDGGYDDGAVEAYDEVAPVEPVDDIGATEVIDELEEDIGEEVAFANEYEPYDYKDEKDDKYHEDCPPHEDGKPDECKHKERPVVYETVVHTVTSCEEEVECHSTEYVPISSAPEPHDMTTKVVYTTSVETIVHCPEEVEECPESSITETIVTHPAFTTVCPVSEAILYTEFQPEVETIIHEFPEAPVEPMPEPFEPVIATIVDDDILPTPGPDDQPVPEQPGSHEPYYPVGEPSDFATFPAGTAGVPQPTGTGVGGPDPFTGAAASVKCGVVLAGLGAVAAFFL